MVARHGKLVSAVLAGALLLGCSTSPDVPIGSGDGGTPSSTPASSATPVLEASTVVWPAARPRDFAATYNEDGGMAPWSQTIDIQGDRAEYEVWMNQVTYTFAYSPTVEQLDAVYHSFRDGRFDEYRVIPFGEGEQVYDAGSNGWSASFGEFSHRIGTSGEEIASPGAPVSALTTVSDFVDQADVPQATSQMSVIFDRTGGQPVDRLNVWFDLGDATFAMGEERWSEQFDVFWSGGERQVAVRVTTGRPQDLQVLSESVVLFSPGGQLLIATDETGAAVVTATT